MSAKDSSLLAAGASAEVLRAIRRIRVGGVCQRHSGRGLRLLPYFLVGKGNPCSSRIPTFRRSPSRHAGPRRDQICDRWLRSRAASVLARSYRARIDHSWRHNLDAADFARRPQKRPGQVEPCGRWRLPRTTATRSQARSGPRRLHLCLSAAHAAGGWARPGCPAPTSSQTQTD